MPDWSFWLIAAGVLAVAETMSLDLVLLMFAGGAAAGGVTAAAGGPVPLQVAVAVVATLALLLGVRPIARRHLTATGASVMGTDALVGMQALTESRVDGLDGRVRLNGGEWSARSFDDTQVIASGTPVRVVRISGATAYVIAEEDPVPPGGAQ